MAKGIKICKVCGKEYEACHTLRPNLNNEFRYQDVACSPECGAIYLSRVLEARGIKQESAVEPKVVEETTKHSAGEKYNRRKKNIKQ